MGLDIIIVGAGIAGLACARALREKHNVKVIEQSGLKAELGAAIHLGPNASRLILPWGVDLNESPRTRILREFDSQMEEIHSTEIDAEKTFGAPWLLNHRVTLHKELLRVATMQNSTISGKPAEILTGKPVISIDTENATIKMKDGSELKADLIIGADGIKSVVRPFVVGNNFSAKPSNHSAYRCLISAEKIRNDEQLSFLLKQTGVTIFLGEDRRVVAYSCVYKGEELVNIVATVPDKDLDYISEESWNSPATVGQLMSSFKTFAEPIQRLLSHATNVSSWQLRDQDPLTDWVKDRVIIVGDAAHPMLPHMGQGGSQAIEDADMLQFVLKDLETGCSSLEINKALKRAFNLRWDRASMCQETSRAQALGPRAEGESKVQAVNPFKFSQILYTYMGAEDWAKKQESESAEKSPSLIDQAQAIALKFLPLQSQNVLTATAE